MWGAEARAGDRPRSQRLAGRWRGGSLRKGAARGREGEQLWPQGRAVGCGGSQAFYPGRPEVSLALVFAPAEVMGRTGAGAGVSASSPENTLGRHIWGKRDTLGEEHEENRPNALGGLRLSNYSGLERGQRILPRKSHVTSRSPRAEKRFAEETQNEMWQTQEGIQRPESAPKRC